MRGENVNFANFIFLNLDHRKPACERLNISIVNFLFFSRGGWKKKNEKYMRVNANNGFRKILIFNSFLRL